MVKRIVIFVLLSYLGVLPVSGQQPKQGGVERLSAEQIRAEIGRLRKETEAVRQSPEAPEEWKETLQIEARLAELKELRTSEEAVRMERYYRRSEPELKVLEFTLRAKTDTPKNERLGTIINSMLASNASTHEAYVDLIEGRSDIGLLARGLSEDELRLAREKNVELEAVACARDAFVFLLNEKNSVKNLTRAQIRAIYSGRTRNWVSVGGPDRPIVAYQREENSGSQELMRALVMKEVPLQKLEGIYVRQLMAPGMGGPFLMLRADANGIGYSVHYYERFMSGSPRTKVIAVDDVIPSYESILEGRYPYVSDVLVVTRKNDDAQSPAKRLRDWLLSAEGQAVVRESGYVPVRSGVLR